MIVDVEADELADDLDHTLAQQKRTPCRSVSRHPTCNVVSSSIAAIDAAYKE